VLFAKMNQTRSCAGAPVRRSERNDYHRPT
jgi:hypothetical protein